MFHGPKDSILVKDVFDVIELKWDKELQELLKTRRVYTSTELFTIHCYVEAFNMFVIMNENKKIEAVELGNNRLIGKLPREVGDNMIISSALTGYRRKYLHQ